MYVKREQNQSHGHESWCVGGQIGLIWEDELAYIGPQVEIHDAIHQQEVNCVAQPNDVVEQLANRGVGILVKVDQYVRHCQVPVQKVLEESNREVNDYTDRQGYPDR
ncbi:hypothetical protein PanWU01x14_030540 [Parasponia andersonii]|uniref:Uncharacterized protein n=1 Tax=Parasponia andersonii TaxID=3476 RepID=A0A2P5DUS9_PARAD|nr:hypothetical protein PanWU01x14_030540 [Parasponia andersonii]